MLYGGVTTKASIGQLINTFLQWTYPTENEAEYEGNDQPITPPVELAVAEIRLTDNKLCLINPENTAINWIYYQKGTSDEPTADLVNDVWVGRDDQISIDEMEIRKVWYYQGRVKSRLGVWSDWTEIHQIIDNPAPIPAPVITLIQTNEANQVKVEWSDVGAEILNFDRYQVFYQVVSPNVELETNGVIVSID